MSDELGTPVIQTEVSAPEGIVDLSPQITPELQAEIDRLAGEKAQKMKREEFDASTKAAEEKARYWREEKAKARAEYFRPRGEEKPPQVQPEATVDVGPEPKKEDFEDYDSYAKALAQYHGEVAATKKIKMWREEEKKEEREGTFKKKVETLIERGMEKYPDFEDVARDPSNSAVTEAVVKAMVEVSENPEDIAYYLGKNRTEAIRLSRMTPLAIAKEIGRIEMEIRNQNPNNPKPKTISDAPPPIKPVGSSESGPIKDPDKMSQKEFEEWRNSQGARRF